MREKLIAHFKKREISCKSENFTINAKGGDDVIITNSGDDYIDAGNGNDVSVAKRYRFIQNLKILTISNQTITKKIYNFKSYKFVA